MKDILGIFNNMKDVYLKYLDSPFALGNDALSKERQDLIEREGVIFQYPYVESLPPYESSRRKMQDLCAEINLPKEYADFIDIGLFNKKFDLHKHQFDAIKESMIKRNHVIVTSGTGSGKTESFLLPLVLKILEESSTWEKPDEKEPYWWKKHRGSFSASRNHEKRSPGIRGLILYPLNALVEDQLQRLRNALDSDKARDWLDENRDGNRIHFGRYTGKTPVPGPIKGGKTQEMKKILKNAEIQEEELKTHNENLQDILKMDNINEEQKSMLLNELTGEQGVTDLITNWDPDSKEVLRGKLNDKYFEKLSTVPRIDGGEMLGRWDMQQAPPDIFITNFSMLNIILTRSLEQDIFDRTREWLEESSDNVFHLILDELHTYRGTAGTEVAYVLKTLLYRLGLTPDSPQLRIIATSASINQEGQEFLEEFFGISKENFSIIEGNRLGEEHYTVESTSNNQYRVECFSEFYKLAQDNFSDATKKLAKNCLIKDEGEKTEHLLNKILHRTGVLSEFVKITKKPQSIMSLQEHFAPGNDDMNEIGGILYAITNALKEDNTPVLPLREHLFFRNFQGLWACSNPGCEEVEPAYSYEGRKVGKLYSQPRLKCGCGGKVLDFYYCQNCGDVYLGGYKNHGHHGQQRGFTLSSDFPDLENLSVKRDKKFKDYTIYWPTGERRSISDWKIQYDGAPYKDQKTELVCSWPRASYDYNNGFIEIDDTSQFSGFMFNINSKDGQKQDAAENMPAFSTRCPSCHTDWSMSAQARRYLKETIDSPRASKSPIRGQRTGFDMIAQVLLESVNKETPEDEESKIVLFSDSRQDAAKLSAKIEQNHYYDQLRYVVAEEVDNNNPQLMSAVKKLSGEETITQTEEKLAQEYYDANPMNYRLLKSYYADIMDYEDIKHILEAASGPLQLSQLWDKIEKSLINEGSNPAGPALSLQKDFAGNKWTDLYNFENVRNVTHRQSLSNDQQEFRRKIISSMKEEVISQILFAQRKRDLESIGIGYLTIDPNKQLDEQLGKEASFWREVVNSSIRILGGNRRHNFSGKQPSASPPSILVKYWKAVAQMNNLHKDSVWEVMSRILERSPETEGYILQTDKLFVLLSNDKGYKCSKCSRLHLQHSGGVCTDCFGSLVECSVKEAASKDYYRHIINTPLTKKRFHSEELTGQTDDFETARRQKLFQSHFDKDDNPLVDEIDLLSVTTTMEAGVDIGSLRVVAMSNMPPQRFNYQQRVGRAGRRGVPLSLSLTLCRGRSHDDWYFYNLDKMTGDDPPQPYIDLTSEKIARRVLLKEFLFHAFTEGLAGVNYATSNSVHGEFGFTKEWDHHRDYISEYINSENGQLRLIEVLNLIVSRTHLNDEQKESMKKFVMNDLIHEITSVANDNRYSSNALSENLASAGLLPMFGFPTRLRLLHHDWRNPRMGVRDLQRGTIDRDLEIAISDYSPGSEIVKDKAKHRAVGLAHYWRQGNQIKAEPNPLGTVREISICENCHLLFEEPEGDSRCPSCDSELSQEYGAPFRKIRISEPLGFRSAWRPEDFTDQFEWTSRGMIPKLAQDNKTGINVKNYGNMKYWNQEGNIYTINDNFGQMFTYHKSKNDFDGWVEEQEVERYSLQDKITDEEETVALASIKNTEVLLLQPDQLSNELNLDANHIGVKAGLLSFGFLFRRIATQMLDIDSNEIQIGIRSRIMDQGIVGEVFLSDQLINGAGYAKHLDNSGFVERIIDDIAINQKEIPNLLNHNCDSSCYRCLRTYDNMIYHPILNWRLGIDLAKVMQDSNFIPSLYDEEWNNLISKSVKALSKMDKEGYVAEENFHTVTFDYGKNVTCIIKHPYLNNNAQSLLNYQNKLLREGYEVKIFDAFDLLHRPEWIIYELNKDYGKSNNALLYD